MFLNNFTEMLPVRPYPLDLDTWLPALKSAIAPLFGLLGLKWGLNWLFDEEDGVVRGYRARLPRPTWRLLTAPARILARLLRYDPLQWRSDALIAEVVASAHALEARDRRTLTWEELPNVVRAAQHISARVGGEVRSRYFPRAGFATGRLQLLLMALGQAGLFGALLSGGGPAGEQPHEHPPRDLPCLKPPASA